MLLSALVVTALHCPLTAPTHGEHCGNATIACYYDKMCCKNDLKKCASLTTAECGIAQRWLLLRDRPDCSFRENAEFLLKRTYRLDVFAVYVCAAASLCMLLCLCVCCCCSQRHEEQTLRVVPASSQIVSADELQKLVPVAAAAARNEAYHTNGNVYFTPL